MCVCDHLDTFIPEALLTRSEDNVEALKGMCIYIYIYIYIYVYTYMYVYTYIYIYMYYVYMYTCVCVSHNLVTLVQEALLMRVEDDVEALEGEHIYVSMYVYVHTYIYIYTYVYDNLGRL